MLARGGLFNFEPDRVPPDVIQVCSVPIKSSISSVNLKYIQKRYIHSEACLFCYRSKSLQRQAAVGIASAAITCFIRYLHPST